MNKFTCIYIDTCFRLGSYENRDDRIVERNYGNIWHVYFKNTFITYLIVFEKLNWAPSSEFVSSSIPSWQILTAHAQPFSGARDLVFYLKVPLDSLLVWASSEGSGETARMRRLAWTFAARIGYKYQIRLTRPKYNLFCNSLYNNADTLFKRYCTLQKACRKSLRRKGRHFSAISKVIDVCLQWVEKTNKWRIRSDTI